MKKIIFILILIFMGLIIFINPIIVSDPKNYNLSSKELKNYIKRAENNDTVALLGLYTYYGDLHKDYDGVLMVTCKGASLGQTFFKSYKKKILQMKSKDINSSLCPKYPLKHLKDYSSW